MTRDSLMHLDILLFSIAAIHSNIIINEYPMICKMIEYKFERSA